LNQYDRLLGYKWSGRHKIVLKCFGLGFSGAPVAILDNMIVGGSESIEARRAEKGSLEPFSSSHSPRIAHESYVRNRTL
jgi:hypothetical protein